MARQTSTSPLAAVQSGFGVVSNAASFLYHGIGHTVSYIWAFGQGTLFGSLNKMAMGGRYGIYAGLAGGYLLSGPGAILSSMFLGAGIGALAGIALFGFAGLVTGGALEVWRTARGIDAEEGTGRGSSRGFSWSDNGLGSDDLYREHDERAGINEYRLLEANRLDNNYWRDQVSGQGSGYGQNR
jgi:hypothetical protein